MTNIPFQSPAAILEWLKRNLARVQKPGRYYGGEFNQILKDWDSVQLHVGLAFPDLYEIGLPNLGLTILYNEINQRQDALAERVYSPWLDMEALMRQNSVPLHSLESKTPIAQFDIIGITLPYETLYTNALNLLDLAGIPIHSKDRGETLPLVMAGGHAISNPEPMADFIDAFVIGEGEEVIHELLDVFFHWQAQHSTKIHLLEDLASIGGVYIPQLYKPVYTSARTLKEIRPLSEKAPAHILRRLVHPLPFPPTRFIVPSIGVVHDRIPVEIMRGCTRGCRFCHAGMTTRPVRQRAVTEIVQAIDASLQSTGYDEIALLSLSSSDHSRIQELVDTLSERYADSNLRISLPSLRIESLSVDLIKSLQRTHHGTFTLAPEAASDKIRNSINKPISSEDVLRVAREIYSHGWSTIKLYFMIGFPNESLADVQTMVDLSRKILSVGREVLGRKAAVHLSVNTFIPKPHTPFQWMAMPTQIQIEERQRILQSGLRGQGYKLSWSDNRQSQLEAWLSRGDRRLTPVIHQAWKDGAKFDAWQDQLKFDAWISAFQKMDLDPTFFSERERSLKEILPWDHISMGVSRRFLEKEFELSKAGKTSPDCRTRCDHCGIIGSYFSTGEPHHKEKTPCPSLRPQQGTS